MFNRISACGFDPKRPIRAEISFLRTGCTMNGNYYLAANKPSPPRFDARPAAGRHGLDRQPGRHAAGHDRQGGFLPYHGRLPLRPDFPRLGRPGGHLRGLQAVQKTLRKHRIPGTDRGQNGGRRTVDRAGRGRRAAGRHGLPGRHDGLQRGGVQNHGRRQFRGAAETAAGRRDQGQQDLRRRAGGQTGADRREKPLRLENLLRTHRPRSLGRPERAGLRGFQPRGKAPGGQHGRKGEGDGRRNQVEARLHPGRESGGHARREPRKGVLGSA